ncbi:MAG: multicopper oxidase domain-containing protein [Xanthobacteraceae bacterium]
MLSRRAFMLSAAAASTALPTLARSQSAPAGPGGGDQQAVLRLHRRSIEVNGKPASVYGIQQPDGTFGIRTEVGKRFRVRVENRIDEPSLIHWHGLTPPWQQDGVPGVSGPPISPGGSADYDFPLRFGGTFWMHSHQGLQEQLLMSAPLIIRDQRDRADQQEVVLTLADFSFTPPEQIFAALKKGGTMSSMNSPPPAAGSASAKAMRPAASAMPAGMAMGAKPDLNDVTYDAFLANDRTLGDPEVVKVEPGGRVLLRVINSSSVSAFHVDLGQLDGELSRWTASGSRPSSHAASRSQWHSGWTSGWRFRAPPRRIPCSRCSKATPSKPVSSCRPGGARSCVFPTRLARLRPRSRSTWKAACAP